MKRLTRIFQALFGVVALIPTALIAIARLAWRTIRNWWKKRSKWVHRSIATILILIPLGFVALIAYALYDDSYGRDYWDDRRVSDNVTLHPFSDNKWMVYNNRTEEHTTEKINWLSEVPENDSLAVYALSGKRGYRIIVKDGKHGVLDSTCNVVYPAEYGYVDVLSDGFILTKSGKKMRVM